jgi:GrpE
MLILRGAHQCKASIARGQWQRVVLSALTSGEMTWRRPNPFSWPQLRAGAANQLGFELSSSVKTLSSMQSGGEATKRTENEGDAQRERHGGEDESEESYARRYASFALEPWEGSESDDEDGREHAFEDYFHRRPGHYVYDMIDRIDGLKGSVRNASADVRERDIALGKLADSILDVSGNVSQMLASLQECDAPGETATMKSLQQIKATLAQSIENAGLASFGTVGDVFDPTIHKASDEGNTSPCGRVAQVSKMGLKLKSRLVRHAAVAVAADPL